MMAASSVKRASGHFEISAVKILYSVGDSTASSGRPAIDSGS